jgi:hypothetical protein
MLPWLPGSRKGESPLDCFSERGERRSEACAPLGFFVLCVEGSVEGSVLWRGVCNLCVRVERAS